MADGGKGSGSVDTESGIKANMKLVPFEFDDKVTVKDQLNANKTAMKNIIDLRTGKGKLRMISKVWVLISGTETQVSKLQASLKASADGASGSFSVGTTATDQVTFQPGSIVAYQVDEIKFDKVKKKKRKWKDIPFQISDLVTRYP